jgi:glycosyltransferase involved in cell wall biosynthesis
MSPPDPPSHAAASRDHRLAASSDREPAAATLVASSLGGDQLDFSIVVPTHDRPQQLARCLTALARLAYPSTRYEVIVVDDGSAHGLEPAIAPWIGRLNVTLLRQANAGPAAARNAGAAAARGRWLAFTDDDCQPEPGWLDALAGALAADPGCAAGGATENGLPANLLATASQLLLQFLYLHVNRDPRDAVFVASNNLTLPRERFLEIGGFDAGFPLAAAEDRELCDRWRWLNGRIVHVPRAVVRHCHDLTLHSFLAQHFNYGRGAWLFFRVKRRRDGVRPALGGFSFYAPMLAFPFRRERSKPRAMAVSALIALSQAAMSCGVFWQGCVGARDVVRRRALGTRVDSEAMREIAGEARASQR